MKLLGGTHRGKRYHGKFHAAVLARTLLGSISNLAAIPTQTLGSRVSSLASSGATEPAAVALLRIQEEFPRRNPGIELVAAEEIRLEGTISEVTTVMMATMGIAPNVINEE